MSLWLGFLGETVVRWGWVDTSAAFARESETDGDFSGFSCTTCHKVGSLGLRWMCRSQVCVTGSFSILYLYPLLPLAVCVFVTCVCVLSPWWLMACCPAGTKKARRRRCLLFHQVAIATVHSGAAIIKCNYNTTLMTVTPPPPLSSLCFPCTAR